MNRPPLPCAFVRGGLLPSAASADERKGHEAVEVLSAAVRDTRPVCVRACASLWPSREASSRYT